MVLIGKSLALFALAGVCEIGGGYLVWQWWRKWGLVDAWRRRGHHSVPIWNRADVSAHALWASLCLPMGASL
jgi:hypothetical protein